MRSEFDPGGVAECGQRQDVKFARAPYVTPAGVEPFHRVRFRWSRASLGPPATVRASSGGVNSRDAGSDFDATNARTHAWIFELKITHTRILHYLINTS